MSAVSLGAAERWRLQFMHDEKDSALTINDLKFPSASRGVAVGYLTKGHSVSPVALVTNDGGQKWDFVKTKVPGLSLFFLNESTGWMVTQKSLWKTVESGRSWTELPKSAATANVSQVYFRDENHGWAVGQAKAFYATTDGGKLWTRVPAVDQVESTRERTLFECIAFANDRGGMVAGVSLPPRDEPMVPAWMDPESVVRQREQPHLMVFFQTVDGGSTWKPSTMSMFGRPTRLALSADGRGLLLLEFRDAFQYPSEVFRLGATADQGGRAFRREDRAVTDVALLTGGPAYLAAIEPPGRLAWSPVPGKVKLIKSADMSTWTEMEVDYRAVAHRAILAVFDAGHAWAATDTGMILRLESK